MGTRKKNPSRKHSVGAQVAPSLRGLESILATSSERAAEGSPQMRAQTLVYQAFEIPNPAKRIALARQALAIWPDCVDAHVLLAEESGHKIEQAIEHFQHGVDAGEHELGEHAFNDDVGHFWGLLETRPYMRARFGLAQALWQFGERSAAITHAQDLLRLNPSDNQGVRYSLLTWLLSNGRTAEAKALWHQNEEDPTANWRYARALMAFIANGANQEAAALLREAFDTNPHVPPFLLSREQPPLSDADYFRIGDRSEAADYVFANIGLWQQTDGALSWLRDVFDGYSSR